MARLLKHRFRRTTLLTVFYLSFLLGVAMAAKPHPMPSVVLAAVMPWTLIARRNLPGITLAVSIALGVGMGLWHGTAYARDLSAYTSLYGQRTTLIVRAVDDGVYGKGAQMSFDAGHIRLEGGPVLPGKVAVSGFGANSIYDGDEVEVTAKLYPGYGSYQARASYARLTVLQRRSSPIAAIRRKFAAGMQSALPEPLASFAMGLLIGQRATLPAEVKQDLLTVGLTHIIAVSGYNLTIMLQAGNMVLSKGSKRLALVAECLLMGTFVFLAGSSASIVRASIVSMLSIAAAYYGRSFKPYNLIALAAAFTVWMNPAYVWSDASWYLSFLAFCGVMILAPLLSECLLPNKRLPLVFAVAVESICAEALTLPYVLHTFGQMSFVGLPANVLVVTLVPMAMLLGGIAGVVGMCTPAVAGWVAWPARVLLMYMLDVSHMLSRIPHIFVQHITFTTTEMMATYACIAAFASIMTFKSGAKNGTITEKADIETKERYGK